MIKGRRRREFGSSQRSEQNFQTGNLGGLIGKFWELEWKSSFKIQTSLWKRSIREPTMKLQLCLCHWASNSAELGLYTTARPCPDHLWPCNLHYSDRVSHRGGSLLLHSVLGKHPLKNKRKREMQRFKELIKVRYSFNSRAGFLSTQRGFSALPDYSQHENLEDQVNLSVSFSISVAS